MILNVISITLFLFCTWVILPIHSYNYSQAIDDYPTPFTNHNKVMGLLLMFNFGHIDPFIYIINEYLSMCEAGWDPTIVVFTVVDWTPPLQRLVRQKLFCYRLQRFVPVVYEKRNPSIGTALGAEPRKYMANYINTTDVFIYHEDDIVVKLNHLTGYLYETKKLHNFIPDEHGLWENTIGFQRFRRLFKTDGHTPYGEQDIIEQELMEEMPYFVPICVSETPYLVVRGNTHQAMWMLTKQQVIMLMERCNFLNQLSASREFMSSFSLFEKKGGHCGLNKILPGDRFMTFSVLHYYQQRHVSWTSVFLADENIRAGFDFHAVPKSDVNPPECWRGMVLRARAEQLNLPLNFTTR